MEYIEYPKTFKKLVEEIRYMASEDDFNRVLWQLDRSFRADRISGKEYETLYNLASMINERRW